MRKILKILFEGGPKYLELIFLFQRKFVGLQVVGVGWGVRHQLGVEGVKVLKST
jgi:hypothetical protein